MDDHFDIGRIFEIGKFDITRLTCITTLPVMVSYTPQFKHKTIKKLRLTLQNGATTD